MPPRREAGRGRVDEERWQVAGGRGGGGRGARGTQEWRAQEPRQAPPGRGARSTQDWRGQEPRQFPQEPRQVSQEPRQFPPIRGRGQAAPQIFVHGGGRGAWEPRQFPQEPRQFPPIGGRGQAAPQIFEQEHGGGRGAWGRAPGRGRGGRGRRDDELREAGGHMQQQQQPLGQPFRQPQVRQPYHAPPQQFSQVQAPQQTHQAAGVSPEPAFDFPTPESVASRLEALDMGEGSSGATEGILEALLPAAEAKEETRVPVSSKAVVAVARPGKGTVGNRVQLRANHVKVALSVETIFHYDVTIAPSISSKGMARALEREMVVRYRTSELGNRLPVYDGSKSLYTAGPLPFDKKDFEVSLPEDAGRARTFKITIKYAAKLDRRQMDEFVKGRQAHMPQEFLQALDVALREWPTKSFVPSGRSFFDPALGRQRLENGLEAWKGFFQSVRPTMQGLALNIDLSATAFYEPIDVLDFLRQTFHSFNPNRVLSDSDSVKARKLLTRLKVEVTHRQTPRKYRIAGLSPRPTKHLTFALEDGTEMKVIHYFQTTYGYAIRFPELPCLELQAKKVSYLPMEVCRLCAGQKFGGRLNERQTTSILRFACQIPAVRERELNHIMETVHSLERNEYAKEFGIQINRGMTSLEGRVLPTPKLKYSTNDITPSRGEWNMMQSRFIQGATIHHWTLINFSYLPPQVANRFKDLLMQRCEQIGMKIHPPVVPIRGGGMEKFDSLIRAVVADANKVIAGKGHLQLIVCLMDARHPLYADLKRVCETEIGVVTQCCLKKHVNFDDTRRMSQYLANLAMKINVKVGGKNVTLFDELPRLLPSVLNEHTIIFGADVSHPMASDDASPSIAAVVASMDWPSAINYLPRVRAQAHRVERIQALEAMVYELLMEFLKRTGKIPGKLLFFRDGVSEGQFYEVLEHEVTAILNACLKVERNYRPKVTFVIVQKRHHTRLFPADRNSEKNNVLPGTVVDTVITHPREFDFYLCSHKGLQGTSRPTHYHVLYDDNKFKADELQMLINNLCYTFARCTKAVSLVPPAYYAHLVAYRARLYVETGDSGSDASSIRRAGSTSSSRTAAAPVRGFPPVMPLVQGVMYYC